MVDVALAVAVFGGKDDAEAFDGDRQAEKAISPTRRIVMLSMTSCWVGALTLNSTSESLLVIIAV